MKTKKQIATELVQHVVESCLTFGGGALAVSLLA